MTNRHRHRLALIGLDAAPLSFIEGAIAELPNLRQAFARGSLHCLRTTADLLHASVWPTFYTGRMPAEHGIYFPLQWDPAAMRMRHVSRDWLYARPFWHELDRRGRRTIALDVPLLFPSPLEHGIEVSSWGAHDLLGPLETSPAGLAREIRRRFGAHPMGLDVPVRKTAGELRQLRDQLIEGARRKGELTAWLLGDESWDFSVTVFGETHRAGHILWPEEGKEDSLIPEGAMLDVYRAIDSAIGELQRDFESRGVSTIIFSLHGMGPNNSQEHFLPQIIERFNERFASQHKGPAHNGSKSNRGRNGNGESGAERRGARQFNLMREMRQRLPARLQSEIARRVPVAVRDMVVNQAMMGGYDWKRTSVVPLLSGLHGLLRYNLRGREREGALEIGTAEYEEMRERLKRVFLNLRVAGSGEPLVREVGDPRGEMAGERVDLLPDLSVVWNEMPPAREIVSDEMGSFSAELKTGRSGNHRAEAFCLLLPAPGAPEFDDEPTHIIDLAQIALRRLAPEL